MGEVINMNPQTEEVKKLSYEELENVATQLQSQCQKLYAELVGMSNTFKRLDYLFKVLKNSGAFPTHFVDSCANEVMELMIPATEENKEE